MLRYSLPESLQDGFLANPTGCLHRVLCCVVLCTTALFNVCIPVSCGPLVILRIVRRVRNDFTFHCSICLANFQLSDEYDSSGTIHLWHEHIFWIYLQNITFHNKIRWVSLKSRKLSKRADLLQTGPSNRVNTNLSATHSLEIKGFVKNTPDKNNRSCNNRSDS